MTIEQADAHGTARGRGSVYWNAALVAEDSSDGEAVQADLDLADGDGERAGRLVAEDEGVRTDAEKDLVATDVGIDGAAAGAEEAAVHVVDDPESGDPALLDAEVMDEEPDGRV